MILSPDQIKQYILHPQNEILIKYQIELKEKHELHLTGEGLDKFIDTVDGIENQDYINVKKKLKNKITVKTFEKVLRAKDKIITAKGGTTIFEFQDKSNEQKLKDALKNLHYRGHSLKSYTETVWLDYGIWIDPMGITMVEHVLDEKIILTDENPTKVFEKSNEVKLDYLSIYENKKGERFVNYHDIDFTSFDRIEYLILNEGRYEDKMGNIYRWYRVVDDEKDEIWTQDESDKENIQLKPFSTIWHGFGKVPAVFNSSRVDKKSINKWFTTYCAEALIIADDMLNDYLDGRIYKKKMGIPQYWEYKMTCRNCGGVGLLENDKDGNGKYYGGKKYRTCEACGGTAHNRERVLTDIAYLEVLETDSQSNVPPFGAVTLPTEIQVLYNTEQAEMERDINDTVWGEGTSVDKERKDTTAFEVSVRNEGKESKLRAIEKNKVRWQTAVINLIGKALFESSYQGVIITPATQFVMLTPTESRQVYIQSKEKKSSEPQLDKLWIDYLNAEYESDPVSLDRQKIIMLLTPMFHFDLPEAWEYLSEQEKIIKKNLEKFIYKYENETGSILMVSNDPNKLNEIELKFTEYANEIIKQKTNDSSIQQNTELANDL